MNQPNSAFNLGRKEKRKRLVFGILFFALGAALGIYFVFEEVSAVFRFLVWPFFFFAMLGFLQAKARTCVILAWKRKENLDSGESAVRDGQTCRTLQRQSQKIILQAFLFSFALTLACFFS